MKLIVTVPPTATYVEKVAAFPSVRGIRFNTVMPVAHEPREVVAALRSRAPEVWIDLKGRQLRVESSSYVPYHHVELSRRIEVRTPVRALFNGGEAAATVSRVEGNRLYLEETPPIPLGAGMSVNILDPSLVIHGYLTDRDQSYVNVGVHTYLLSYVEESRDIEDLLALDPEARILAKIESKKGLAWARNEFARYADRVNLVAARGDLFLELDSPGEMLEALRLLIQLDPDAVAASRILSSLRNGERPTCEEVCDIGLLARLGYHTLLLGDELSFREKTLMHAVATLEGILAHV